MKSAKEAGPTPTGGTSQGNAGFTPGHLPGPFSPGEAPNQFMTPDCPKSEADIAKMEKK